MNYLTTLTPLLANGDDSKLSKKMTKVANNIELNNEFAELLNLSLNVFEWSGLPETCNERMLELLLTYTGRACLYKDELGIWSFGATIGGELTAYGMPSKGYAYALNGINKPCKYFWDFMDNTDANAVLCLDNKVMYPPIYYIIRSATTISDALRAVQVAANNSKLGFVFSCSEEQKKSLENIINGVQDNQIAIITSKDADLTAPAEMFNANIDPNLIDQLWKYYQNFSSDAKTRLGIMNNKNNDKKERMVNSEVTGDLQYIYLNIDHRLDQRKEFCERCNKYLGTNISVKIKNDPREYVQQALEAGQNNMFGGNNNGNNNTVQNTNNK